MIDKDHQHIEKQGENTIVNFPDQDSDIAKPESNSEAMQAAVQRVEEKKTKTGKIYGVPTAAQHYEKHGRLTPQQHLFVQGIIAGKGKSQSYRDAYHTNGNDMTVAVAANKLLKNRKVINAISAAEERIQINVISDAVRTREYVMQQLLEKSRDGKTESTQLKALELMGRAVSMFSDRVEQTVEHIDPAKLKEELKAHLMLIEGAQG